MAVSSLFDLKGKVVVVTRKSQLFHLTGPLIVIGSMHEIRRFPGSGFPCSTRRMRIRSVLREGVSDHISAQAPFHRERKVHDDLIIFSKYGLFVFIDERYISGIRQR